MRVAHAVGFHVRLRVEREKSGYRNFGSVRLARVARQAFADQADQAGVLVPNFVETQEVARAVGDHLVRLSVGAGGELRGVRGAGHQHARMLALGNHHPHDRLALGIAGRRGPAIDLRARLLPLRHVREHRLGLADLHEHTMPKPRQRGRFYDLRDADRDRDVLGSQVVDDQTARGDDLFGRIDRGDPFGDVLPQPVEVLGRLVGRFQFQRVDRADVFLERVQALDRQRVHAGIFLPGRFQPANRRGERAAYGRAGLLFQLTQVPGLRNQDFHRLGEAFAGLAGLLAGLHLADVRAHGLFVGGQLGLIDRHVLIVFLLDRHRGHHHFGRCADCCGIHPFAATDLRNHRLELRQRIDRLDRHDRAFERWQGGLAGRRDCDVGVLGVQERLHHVDGRTDQVDGHLMRR